MVKDIEADNPESYKLPLIEAIFEYCKVENITLDEFFKEVSSFNINENGDK